MGGANGEMAGNGHRASFCRDENDLELDSS